MLDVAGLFLNPEQCPSEKKKVELLKQLIHLLKLNATNAMETDISQQLRRQKQAEQIK